jgi:hypothetical protein
MLNMQQVELSGKRAKELYLGYETA